MDQTAAGFQNALMHFQAAPLQNAAGKNAAPKNLAQIEEAAKEFEAVFLAQMLAPMFDGLETGGPFGGGHAEQVYRSLLIDEYGRQVAAGGGIGIADAVKNYMISVQAENALPHGEGEVKHDTDGE